ncbi:hypothetical protein Q7P35_001982 [Cladosporium inversicolor]
MGAEEVIRYVREDAYRDYRERDDQRRPARSLQRAPRRHERDGERDLRPGGYVRHEERRSHGFLYRLRSRGPEPSLSHHADREAFAARVHLGDSTSARHAATFGFGTPVQPTTPSANTLRTGGTMTRLSTSRDPHRRASVQANMRPYPTRPQYDDSVFVRRSRSPSRE